MMQTPSRAVFFALSLVVALGVMVALALTLRVSFGNWVVQRGLNYFSVPLSAELTAIEGDRLVLRGLRFTQPGLPTFEVEELAIRYTLGALSEGRVEQVVLRKPVIQLPGKGEPAGEALPSSGEVRSEATLQWPPPLLIERIIIENGTLRAEHDDREISTSFEAEAKLSGGDPSTVRLDLAADGDLGTSKVAIAAGFDDQQLHDLQAEATGRLLPALNILLPAQLQFQESGEIAFALSLRNLEAVSLPSPFLAAALTQTAISFPFEATLETHAKAINVGGLADVIDSDVFLELERLGEATVLGEASYVRATAVASAGLPERAKEALALINAIDSPIALSLERERDGAPLAIVSMAGDEVFIDLAAAAALSGAEDHRLDLSFTGQLRLDAQAGELREAEFVALEGDCRCRMPATGEPLRLRANTALRIGPGRIELPRRFAARLESDTDIATLFGSPDLSGLLGPSLEIDVRQRNTAAPLLFFDPATDGGFTWNTDIAFKSDGALETTSLASAGRAKLPAADAPLRLKQTQFDLALGPFVWQGQDVTSLRARGLVEGGVEDLATQLHLSANAQAVQAGGMALGGLSLDSALSLRKSGTDLRLSLTEPSTLGLATLDGLPVALSNPLDLALQTTEARISLGKEFGWAIETRGDIAPLQLRAEGRAVQVGGSRFEASLEGGESGLPQGRTGIETGALSLSDPKVRTGPAALALTSNGRAVDATLAPTLVTQAFVPAAADRLLLSGSARLAENRLTGRARASLPNSDVHAALRFRHDLKTAKGRGDFEIPEITFSPTGLQPSALSPRLGDIEEASGSLSGNARLSWQGDKLDGSADIEVQALSFKREEVFVEGFDTAIVLTSLFPLAADGPQSFAAARAGSGELALDGIEGRFAITSEGPEAVPTFRLEEATGGFAGGLVRLAGQTVQPDGIREAGRIEIADIELTQLLSRLRIDGLSGNGQLSGRLPLRFEEDTLIIEGGEVSANAPGRLAYNSPTARQALATAGDHMKLTLDALQDFSFTDLMLRLDKPARGDSELAITLEGSNPAVLDNYPFRFNIRLTGDPAPFITAITEGTRLSDEILRRAWTHSRPPPY